MKIVKMIPLIPVGLCLLMPMPAVFAQAPSSTKGTPIKQPETLQQAAVVASVGLALTIKPNPAALALDQAREDEIVRGQAKMKTGDLNGAITDFQSALGFEPHDAFALEELATAYTASGQTDEALNTYRTLLYGPPGQKWGNSAETDPAVLMHFALLLQQTGQTKEAIAAFQRGLVFLNSHSLSKPAVPVPAPGADSIPDTPQGFQASSQLALFVETFGHEGYGVPEPLAHLQQALSLAPDSSVANYYMGKYLCGKNDTGAKAYLQKAVELGDDQTAAAAQIYLKCLH